jgi:ABC-2 type transport system permease protein
MKILSIAGKDLQILLKDRGAIFQLFILPLLFILVFSGALGAIGKPEEVVLPKLGIVDLDDGSAAEELMGRIQADRNLTILPYTQDEAQALLDKKELDFYLVIPAGFTTSTEAGQPVTLRLITGASATKQMTESAQLVLASAAAGMTLESQIIASLKQMGDMQADSPTAQQAFNTERILAQARTQFKSSRVQPLIVIVQSTPQQEASQQASPDLSLSTVPGFAVLFVFMTAQATAHSIYDEKKVGSFRRLTAAPLSKAQLLIGKILPNFIIGLVQIAVIFAFGSLGLRLIGLTPLPIENAPLGAFLVAVMLALCSSAFGIMVAALARTENQIAGLSTLLLWGMGLLGGCLVPLFLLERFLGPIPMIVPHYWANRALDDLLIRGLGPSVIALDLAVLLGFTLLFFIIGMWRFDFER